MSPSFFGAESRETAGKRAGRGPEARLPPAPEGGDLEVDDEGHGRSEQQARPEGDVRGPYVPDQRDGGEGGRGEREKGPGIPPQDLFEGRRREAGYDPRIEDLEGDERQADDRRRGQQGGEARPEGVREDRVIRDRGREFQVYGQPRRGEGDGKAGPEWEFSRVHGV